MAIDHKAMGRRIKFARQKARITQEKLAELLDVSIVHISNIESGSGAPSLGMLVNIANTLAVSTDELLCDSVKCTGSVFRKELVEVVEDCDDYEIRVLVYILKAARAALKDDKLFREKMREYEELWKICQMEGAQDE